MFISIMIMKVPRLLNCRNGMIWPANSFECIKLIFDQYSIENGLAQLADSKEKSKNWSEISTENAVVNIPTGYQAEAPWQNLIDQNDLKTFRMKSLKIFLLIVENDDLETSSESLIILAIECATLFVISNNGPETISLNVVTNGQSRIDGKDLFVDGKMKFKRIQFSKKNSKKKKDISETMPDQIDHAVESIENSVFMVNTWSSRMLLPMRIMVSMIYDGLFLGMIILCQWSHSKVRAVYDILNQITKKSLFIKKI